VTVGNAEINTALNLNAGSGNMVATVTSGTYTLDASGGIDMETETTGAITIGNDAGVCASPSTATSSAGCSSSWVPTTGAIKMGTGGQRVLTIGNVESNTALNVQAGSGNMATTVTNVHIATVVSHSRRHLELTAWIPLAPLPLKAVLEKFRLAQTASHKQ